MTTTLVFSYAAADVCAASVPTPSDLFVDDELYSDRSACPGASDPIQAAIDKVTGDDGVALDAAIRLPLTGVAVSPSALTGTSSFALVGTSSGGAVPPFVLLEQIGTPTTAAGWKLVSANAVAQDGAVVVTPSALEEAHRYVLVLTSEVKNTAGTRLTRAAATASLVGATPIIAGSYEGLDADSAAKLERERLRLAPIVGLLATASPPIPAAKIIAITGFTTELGFKRFERHVAAYQAALAVGRIPLSVSTTGGDLLPESIDDRWRLLMQMFGGCPPNRPISGCYDHVRAFRRGVIKVPKLLDEQGHLRKGWANGAVETTDLPFLFSLPTGAAGPYPVAVLIPGFGRGRIDARELSNDFGSRLGAGLMAIDLWRQGERTIDPATGMPDSTDVAANNGNPEFAGTDGIPDKSSAGFFPGDPRALRDSQIAAAIEVMHALETLRAKAPFTTQGMDPDGHPVHLVGHGHGAQTAVLAAAFSPNVSTLVLPSGGAGLRELISGGPDLLKSTFLASAPSGVTMANLDDYLGRLEAKLLKTISIEEAAARTKVRLIDSSPAAPRVLQNFGGRALAVPEAARTRLSSALHLSQTRISQHHGLCDDFFLYTCTAGDNFAWVAGARQQIAAFASSGGVTVLPPAP
ncbi:MAG: hypothetical protein U1E65_14135 [Myxococcota bacterium]